MGERSEKVGEILRRLEKLLPGTPRRQHRACTLVCFLPSPHSVEFVATAGADQPSCRLPALKLETRFVEMNFLRLVVPIQAVRELPPLTLGWRGLSRRIYGLVLSRRGLSRTACQGTEVHIKLENPFDDCNCSGDPLQHREQSQRVEAQRFFRG